MCSIITAPGRKPAKLQTFSQFSTQQITSSWYLHLHTMFNTSPSWYLYLHMMFNTSPRLNTFISTLFVFLYRYNLYTIKFILLKYMSMVFSYEVVQPMTTIEFQNNFITPKRNDIHISSYFLFPCSPSSSQSLVNTHLFSITMNLPILNISYKKILKFVAFCAWLVSLGVQFCRLIHVVVCISASLLLMAESHFLCVDIPHFVYLSIGSCTFGLFLLFEHYT